MKKLLLAGQPIVKQTLTATEQTIELLLDMLEEHGVTQTHIEIRMYNKYWDKHTEFQRRQKNLIWEIQRYRKAIKCN